MQGIFFFKINESGSNKKPTLSGQFRKQLVSLMNTLNEATPHYIRCIKPNEDKAPLTFVASNCYEQLTYCGVFEAVAIRKQGYPFRLKHKMFYHRYLPLIKHLQETTSNTITINPDGHSLEGEQISYREKIDHLISFFTNALPKSPRALYKIQIYFLHWQSRGPRHT